MVIYGCGTVGSLPQQPLNGIQKMCSHCNVLLAGSAACWLDLHIGRHIMHRLLHDIIFGATKYDVMKEAVR